MFWAAKTGPEAGMPYDDPGYVSEQYSDASNLGTRVALHGRFSTNGHPWQRWVLAAYVAGHDGEIFDLTEMLERELASRGGVHVTKDTGMFVARK